MYALSSPSCLQVQQLQPLRRIVISLLTNELLTCIFIVIEQSRFGEINVQSSTVARVQK